MDYTESLRLELLKATYRLDANSHPDLYRATEEAKAKLGLEIPVTIYQASRDAGMQGLNAALFHVAGEGHILLSGPVLSLLTHDELVALLGHELAHYFLWQAESGEFLVADRLLQAIAQHPQAEPSHLQSTRWYQLYTEIYADRGSLSACGNIEVTVSALVKMTTGLQQVSGASYLKQAREVFEQSMVKTSGLSHPEAFIRARALHLWSEAGHESEKEISRMIEGSAAFDELDLLGQVNLTADTRRFLEVFLQPRWFHTDAVMAHARLFFDDFKPTHGTEMELVMTESRLKEYVCYLMLDFATVDPELDDLPLAAAFRWSGQLGIETEFEKIVTKELKLKSRELNKLKKKAAETLEQAM